MKQTHLQCLKTVVFIFAALCVIACSKEDNLNNLSDTINVRHKDADMPAYIYGNGSEKVFLITLHGGPGGLGLSFRNTMFKEQIETKYAVVYFDQRGSGMAQGSYNENEINIDIMAEDVLALVKIMKKKYGDESRFFLLGHSWGGTLGTAALLKDQRDFLGWIEIAGANNPLGVYFENITNYKRVASEQIALGNSIGYWESVKELVNSVDSTIYTTNDFRKLNQETVAAENRLMRDDIINDKEDEAEIFVDYNLFTALWNIGTIQSIEERFFEKADFTERLSEIAIPSLFLWGKYDMVVPATFGQEAFDTIGSKNKELVIFERSGHSPMVTEADRFAEEVITFMNANK